MNNYRYVSSAKPTQAWGVAFKEGDIYTWCYGHGPEKFGWTERAARMSAYESNNGSESGPYIAVVQPGHTIVQKDLTNEYYAGPVSDEQAKRCITYHEKLLKEYKGAEEDK